MDATEITARLINHARRTFKFSDQQIADLADISRTGINEFRRQVRAPSLTQFLTLCAALDIDPADAIQGRPEGAPPPDTIHIGPHAYTLNQGD